MLKSRPYISNPLPADVMVRWMLASAQMQHPWCGCQDRSDVGIRPSAASVVT